MFKLGHMYRVGKFVGDIRVYKKPVIQITQADGTIRKAECIGTIPMGSLIMPVKMEFDGVARIVYVKAMYEGTMGWFGVVEDIAYGAGRSSFSNYFQEIEKPEDMPK